MTKINNKYKFISRYKVDIHRNLFVQKIKFKRLHGTKSIISFFIKSKIRRSKANLLLLDSSRGDKFKRLGRKTHYGVMLSIQRKLRVFYGFRRETQLKKLVNNVLLRKSFKSCISRLSHLLELRIDFLLWRVNFEKNIITIRQIIEHEKVFINGKVVKWPSKVLNIGDVISVEKNFFSKEKFYKNFVRKSLMKQTIIKEYNSWIIPNPNFVDVDYKNFVIVVNSKPKIKTDLFYPFGSSIEILMWFYDIKISA